MLFSLFFSSLLFSFLLVSSRLVSSRLVSSRLVSSRLFSSGLFSPSCGILQVRGCWKLRRLRRRRCPSVLLLPCGWVAVLERFYQKEPRLPTNRLRELRRGIQNDLFTGCPAMWSDLLAVLDATRGARLRNRHDHAYLTLTARVHHTCKATSTANRGAKPLMPCRIPACSVNVRTDQSDARCVVTWGVMCFVHVALLLVFFFAALLLQ